MKMNLAHISIPFDLQNHRKRAAAHQLRVASLIRKEEKGRTAFVSVQMNRYTLICFRGAEYEWQERHEKNGTTV